MENSRNGVSVPGETGDDLHGHLPVNAAAESEYHDRRMQDADCSQAPFTTAWEVTRACAYACVHCRADAQHRSNPDELTTGEAQAAAMISPQEHETVFHWLYDLSRQGRFDIKATAALMYRRGAIERWKKERLPAGRTVQAFWAPASCTQTG